VRPGLTAAYGYARSTDDAGKRVSDGWFVDLSFDLALRAGERIELFAELTPVAYRGFWYPQATGSGKSGWWYRPLPWAPMWALGVRATF